MRSFDNYYTYENKIVKVYLDKECTDLILTGVFKGDRIIVDGDEDFPYYKGPSSQAFSKKRETAVVTLITKSTFILFVNPAQYS